MASTYKRRNREFEMLLARRADDLQRVRGYSGEIEDLALNIQRSNMNELLGECLAALLNTQGRD
jgi:hypothetical protein